MSAKYCVTKISSPSIGRRAISIHIPIALLPKVKALSNTYGLERYFSDQNLYFLWNKYSNLTSRVPGEEAWIEPTKNYVELVFSVTLKEI